MEEGGLLRFDGESDGKPLDNTFLARRKKASEPDSSDGCCRAIMAGGGLKPGGAC